VKLVTWNVNSVKMRLARTKGVLLRHGPDVLALQELKASAERFPSAEFQELGYRVAVHGQAGRNGVALLSRGSITDVADGFSGDPVPDQARVVAATIDGVRIVNLYVVNGRAVGTTDYELKLRWLDAFGAWIRAEHDPGDPLLVVGDFNVAPEDRDVHDPTRWRGSNLCSEAERERVGALLDWGLVDLLRVAPRFSWIGRNANPRSARANRVITLRWRDPPVRVPPVRRAPPQLPTTPSAPGVTGRSGATITPC
jgi:exodeoxyribonuclease-3